MIRPGNSARVRGQRWIIAGVVLLLLVGVGAYWYTNTRGIDGTPVGRATAETAPASQDGSGVSNREPSSVQPLEQIDLQGNSVPPTGQILDAAVGSGAVCAGVSVALMSVLSGPYAEFDEFVLPGSQLAVTEHNAANPNCQVALLPVDTEADVDIATAAVEKTMADASVVAAIGPAFSSDGLNVGGVLDAAGITWLTPSATDPALSAQGWKNFSRGLANDAMQPPALANYLTDNRGYSQVCVVPDDTEYSISLAGLISAELGSVANPFCVGNVIQGQQDFASTVEQIAAVEPEAVIYTGFAAEAGRLGTQLRDAEVEADFVLGDGSYDAAFLDGSVVFPTGTLVLCTCAVPPPDFVTKYVAAFDASPGVYAVEAYDLTAIVLAGIDSGLSTREELAAYVEDYAGDGYGRHYEWADNGELTAPTVWFGQVE